MKNKSILASDMVNQAISAFGRQLLSSEIADHILKIIQFGSTLRGKVSENSDIDLLIVSADGEKVHEKIAEIAFQIQMDFGVGIEPIIENLDDIIGIRTYFVFNVLRYGKEVYTVDEKKIKKEARVHFAMLADEYLESAKDALKAEHFRLAVDAGYNAAELSLKAMLLEKVDTLPGSHGGIIGRFGEIYVKTGQLDKAFGRRLNQALELRNNARYKYQASIDISAAESVIALAAAMIEQERNTR